MERTSDSTSSTDAERRDPSAAPRGVALGRVVGAHGMRGELRVRVFGDDARDWHAVSSVTLEPETGEPTTEYGVARVADGRRGEVRVRLVGVDGREAAEALRGHRVLARAAELEALPPGEYYEYELVGCAVEDREGRPLGTVRGVWDTGAPLLVIEGREGREHLVPIAEPLLLEVDVAACRIVVDAIPGLIEEG